MAVTIHGACRPCIHDRMAYSFCWDLFATDFGGMFDPWGGAADFSCVRDSHVNLEFTLLFSNWKAGKNESVFDYFS